WAMYSNSLTRKELPAPSEVPTPPPASITSTCPWALTSSGWTVRRMASVASSKCLDLSDGLKEGPLSRTARQGPFCLPVDTFWGCISGQGRPFRDFIQILQLVG